MSHFLKKISLFSPGKQFLKALKAATFLCFGFVPLLFLVAPCPALQTSDLFSPLPSPFASEKGRWEKKSRK